MGQIWWECVILLVSLEAKGTRHEGEVSACTSSSLWSFLYALACCEEPPFSLFVGHLVPLQRKGKEPGPMLYAEIFIWPTFSSFCSGKDKHELSVSVTDFTRENCTFANCTVETLPHCRLQKDPTETDKYIARSWQQGMLLKVCIWRRVRAEKWLLCNWSPLLCGELPGPNATVDVGSLA